MSNGTNIIDRIRELSLDENVMSTAINGFRNIPTSTDTLPTTEITQVLEKLSGLAVPDATQAAGDREVKLKQLLEGGISNPDEILMPLTQQFDRVFELVAGKNIQSLTEFFDPFRKIFTNIPSDPLSLLSTVREPLVGVLDILVKDTRLLGLQRYSQQIEQVSTIISGNPQEIVNIIQTQIEQATTVTTGPVNRAKEGTTTAISGAASDYKAEEIATDLQTLLSLFEPETGRSLAERITTLNTENDAEVTALISELESARNALRTLGNRAINGLNSALTRFDDVSSAKLTESLEVAYKAIGNLKVDNVLDLGLGINEVFDSIKQTLDGINPDTLLQPIREGLEQLRTELGEIGLTELQDSVVSGLTEAKELVEETSRLQIELTASLHNIISSVTDSINQIDLSGLITMVQEAINEVEPFINEIKSIIDSIDSAIDSVLDAISEVLGDLSNILLNEETGVKKQIENFLDEILQVLDEVNLNQVLADLAQALETVFDKLEELTFNPVIATVLDELEKMRMTLQEIDVSSLNDLLRKALKTALTVVVELGNRYKSEIETKLLEEYDDLIVDSIVEPFDFLQKKFDELFGWIEVLDPAFLIRESGLISLYEKLQEELNSFKPGKVLEDVDSLFSKFRDQLDKFSPEKFLGEIITLFEQLKDKVNTLSPAQLIDPLEKLLVQLKDKARELDISSFTDSLQENIGALTNIVDTISFDSARSALNEVYKPIIDGVNAVNPEPVFRPILDFKQQLIDAISQADLSSLEPVLCGVGGNFEQVKLENVKTNLLTLIDETITAMNKASPTEMIGGLRSPATAIKNAAAGLPSSPAFEPRRAEIINLANTLDPFPILSSAVEKFNTLLTTLTGLKSEAERSLSETGELASSTQAADAVYNKLSPELDPTANIKDTITTLINAAFENFSLEAVQRTYDAIVAAVNRFSPENLLSAVQNLMDEIVGLIRSIGDPSEVIIAVEEVNNAFMEALDRISFEPLKTDLENAFSALIAKLDELNPTRIIAPITEQYNNLVGIVERVNIGNIIERLDKMYEENVLKIVAGLHPQVVLIKPLQEAFEDILKLIKGLNINVVFEPLLKQLEQLRKELEEGLDQVGNKLFQTLQTIPL